MNQRAKRFIGGAIVAAGVIAAGVGIAGAQGGKSDAPITGTAYGQASAAALQFIGAGRITETEVGDEEGYYEVEVTLDDGSQVDVHLDQSFNVLGQEADGADTDDEGGSDDA
jgi:hypothetical protein